MSQIYFILSNTLHVSDVPSVHHQEFKTVHTATGILPVAVCMMMDGKTETCRVLLQVK